MQKDFDSWNIKKKQIDKFQDIPLFKERDVWWCSIGLNIGHEQNGKGDKFSRPVLITKKFNHRLFWAVPLTTQIKDIKHYHQFTFVGTEQCAMLTHMRLFDATRLLNRMGRLSEKEFQKIRAKIRGYSK